MENGLTLSPLAKNKNKNKKKRAAPTKTLKEKKKPVSLSVKAGLEFPVTRTKRLMKQYLAGKTRILTTAAVYMTSVLQYVATEIVETSGNRAKELGVKRITHNHIFHAFKADVDWSQMDLEPLMSGSTVLPLESNFIKNKKLAERKKRESSKTSK